MIRSSRFLLPLLLCAFAAALLFCTGLGGGFVLDDGPTIVDNAAVHVSAPDADALARAAYSFESGSRPLPMLTLALDHWRAGLDPAAFKLTNIVIHALTVLAIAGFLRLLLTVAGWPPQRASWMAIGMALAWALHPLQVSSVLYVVQRMQTLGTLFVVLALWSYLKARQAQIDGQPGRRHWVLMLLSWGLAMASKEDSALFPAYALAIELTVLRFRASSPALANGLRKGWLLASIAAAALFVLMVVPHYWSWEQLPFRDFSTYERLLTQTRVLAMYLGQILLPWPDHMPFFYDGLPPSRGWLQPPTTLLCFLLLLGMAALAWWCRRRRPLFTLGILLFFLGHAMASNVIGLELAFEHRNHFPLLGIVLAMGDLIVAAAARLRLGSRTTGAVSIALLAVLAVGTTVRLDTWNDPLGFASTSTRLAPGSERAWVLLCQTYHSRSQGDVSHPDFKRAVEACMAGTQPPHGITSMANVVVLKSQQGNVTDEDWNRLLERAKVVALTPDNRGAIWHLVKHAHQDERIDPRNTLRLIDTVAPRMAFDPLQLASLGYFMVGKDALQDDALRYFILAAQALPPDSPLLPQLIADLEANERADWARELKAIAAGKNGLPQLQAN